LTIVSHLMPIYYPLRCPICITAAAGTKISQDN